MDLNLNNNELVHIWGTPLYVLNFLFVEIKKILGVSLKLKVRGLWVKFGPFLIDGSKIISKEQLTRERTQFGSQFAKVMPQRQRIHGRICCGGNI